MLSICGESGSFNLPSEGVKSGSTSTCVGANCVGEADKCAGLAEV